MTNTTPTDEVVLKQDVLGRVKTPTARREQLLDEFERSGLPGLKFAELAGIKYQTFATWAQKRRRQRGAYPASHAVALRRRTVKRPKQLRWLEAVVEQNAGDKNSLPLPERLLDRSLPAPRLLAQILVGKYCDHLPLYRQEQIFAQRHHVHLPRQTLARWVELAADWLKPIYEHIRTGVMAGGYAQVDETPIEYLEPGNGKTKQGYFWACNRPGGDVFYHWQTSRAAACLDNIIPDDFAGIIQCDGYSAYRAFANKRIGIELAGCWAHVRRKFYDALEQSPRTAGWLVKQIQNLYRIENRLREHRAGPKLRAAMRAAQGRPIVERIRRALLRLKASGRYLPQSLLAQAIDYTLSQWPTLEVYLDDGRVELDNNLVENAIRPTAIGKKNWLFIGDAQAGQRSAIIYTVIENCRRRGLDPFAYLRDVLTARTSQATSEMRRRPFNGMAANM